MTAVGTPPKKGVIQSEGWSLKCEFECTESILHKNRKFCKSKCKAHAEKSELT